MSTTPPLRSDDGSADARFRGKVIVITGAGGDFGSAGCLYFARRGARVAAVDRDAAALSATLAAAQSLPETTVVRSYVCDVTDAAAVDATIAAITDAFDRIDLLWNNAGYQGEIRPTLAYDPVDFSRVMDVNVTGAFVVLQAVAKRMAAARGGDAAAAAHPCAIVNTASVAALRGTPAMVAYAASKAAVLAMTVSAAKDLAPHGIRVNAISPALIGPGRLWARQNELHAASGSPYFADDPAVVARNKVGGVPMKRLGTVDEVLKSVAYLLSDDSSYTTGTNLVVDGGLSAGLK